MYFQKGQNYNMVELIRSYAVLSIFRKLQNYNMVKLIHYAVFYIFRKAQIYNLVELIRSCALFCISEQGRVPVGEFTPGHCTVVRQRAGFRHAANDGLTECTVLILCF